MENSEGSLVPAPNHEDPKKLPPFRIGNRAGAANARILTDKDIADIEAYASRGMTLIQIAHSLGIGESTLYKKKALNVKVREAILRGRSKGIAVISNALFESAKAGHYGAQRFYLINRAKWTDQVELIDNPNGDIPPKALKADKVNDAKKLNLDLEEAVEVLRILSESGALEAEAGRVIEAPMEPADTAQADT